MASDDEDIPETGAIFTFGKTRFAENLANKFWIRDDKVLQLSCGDEHSAVITNSGRLYTFGSNDWGQLGHGNNKPYTKPSVVKKLKGDQVKFVACGRSHTLVITESGVFSFGAGADSQLGHGDNKSYNVPTQIESLDNKDISKVACGAEHSAALTENGHLYMWGSGSEGQLGLGISECELPTQLKFRSKVLSVACGYYHTAVIAGDGKLFTFGDNDGGKLGLEEHQCYNTEEPQHVKTLNEPVVSVACGGSHTAVVTERGSLYTFGYGMHGQLGHGPSCQEVPSPRQVASLKRKCVTVVSCGESHTAVVTKSGELYTCGDGRHGKLGMGDESFSNLFKPERVTRFKGFHVSYVACGGCHMLAVATKNLEGSEESEESEEDLVRSTVAPDESGEDVVDGPQPSPRLSATVPLTGLSARDKRRQKDLENTTLSGSLPPLNRSSLPPLASLGISNIKKEDKTIPTTNGGANPLDRSTLPTISLREPSPVEEDGNAHKEPLNQSASARRLPPRPKKRQKKPTPASDSEEDAEDMRRELNTTIRPKPVPRKQKKATQDEENSLRNQESAKNTQEKPDTKEKSGSDASAEDSEEEESVNEKRRKEKDVPTSSRSLAEAKKSEKIETRNGKMDDEEDEDADEDEDEEEENSQEEEENGKEEVENGKEEEEDELDEEDESEDEEDEEDDDDDEEEGEQENNEKLTKSSKTKKSETDVTKIEKLDSAQNEDEDEDEDEDKGKDKKKKKDKGKGKKEDDKESNEGGRESKKKKEKKERNEDKEEENADDDDEAKEAKSGKTKTKLKGKKKKDSDKDDKKSGEEENENKTEEDHNKEDEIEDVKEDGEEEGNKDGKEEAKKDGKDEGSKTNVKMKGDEDKEEDAKKQEDGKGDNKGTGQKTKKSGICLLL